ncbi:hypothetical protein [Massilia soli]|uniref:Uncharacterized protein n=1 Tax=Massilia soli TaxID=2792854 RepID=A0ABS7SV50_9BURK|nr:hypothetical protein [Massilia soli]MBZ2209804.1 hypothetical protein [Massilia soli]
MEFTTFKRAALGGTFAATLLSGCMPMPMHMRQGEAGHGGQKGAMAAHMADMKAMCAGMREKMMAARTPEERMAVMHAQMQSMPPDAQQRMHEHMRSMPAEARARMHNHPGSMCE